MKKLIFFLAIALLSSKVFAFAENVTYGYVNCMACHVSPSGGGLLNDYGRSLSKELMSTWGWKGSEQPAFGLIKNTESVKVGGNLRAIQTYYENNQNKQGKQFLMQQNVELGLKFMKTWFIGTLGTQEGPKGGPDKGHLISERHYALWEVNDSVRLRAGKFRHHFGLNDPAHTRVTKAPLGFGSNSETYNIEFSHFGENSEIFFTSDFGKIDQSRTKTNEKSFSVNFAHYLNEKNKIGSSLLFGEKSSDRRQVLNLYGVLNPIAHTIYKFDSSFQQNVSYSTQKERTDLLAMTSTFGLPLFKGFMPYLVNEFIQRDLQVHNTRSEAYGAGIQWLPLPHFEIQLEYQRKVDRTPTKQYADYAWLVTHFFL